MLSSNYEALPHEETFDVKPIGVRYICEFCNEGEMRFISNQCIMSNERLYEHRCTKCGKTMKLPKVYPYVEWTRV